MSYEPKYAALTEEQRQTAIDMALKGEPLPRIISEIMVSEYIFNKNLKEDPKFSMDFDEARQSGLELIADSLLNIADEYADVMRGRLKSENIRWLLSKRKPAVYGDKIDVNLTNKIDLSAALNEAKQRALGPSNIIEVLPNADAIHLNSAASKSGNENE